MSQLGHLVPASSSTNISRKNGDGQNRKYMIFPLVLFFNYPTVSFRKRDHTEV